MADMVNIDQMAQRLAQAMAEYDEEVSEKVKNVVDDVADETVGKLRSKSPSDTGVYAKGWRKKKVYETHYKKMNKVHNSKKYQLTHLLEKGHVRKNTDRAGVVHKSKVSWTAERKHIAPIEKETIEKFEERIKETLR